VSATVPREKATERELDAPADEALDEAGAARVLIVDDEESIRLALSRYLRTRGYAPDAAASGEAALDSLARRHYALLICDVRMPNMSGLELVPRARAAAPDLAIIMLSAVNDAVTAAAAMSAGAIAYLLKPVDLRDLSETAERALHQRAELRERCRLEQRVRDEVAQRTAELERERSTLREMTVGVAHSLINAMEARDPYLRGRSQRVAALAASIADALELDEDTVEEARMAGRLADVGMIGLREGVLHKPSRLTPEEYEHVKQHVRIGLEILAPLKHLGQALEFMHDHHEHLDGSGYPRGLSGDRISIGGRILAAADAFDALTSRRAYRESLTPQATLERMAEFVGRHFDPIVFDALRTVIERRKSLTFIDDAAG